MLRHLAYGSGGSASAPLDVTVDPPTDVELEGPPLAPALALRVEPNPFNPRATVVFHTERQGPVEAELYDARGRRLATLVRATLPPGVHRVPLVAASSSLQLASGVYLVRLHADGREQRVKAVLVR